MAAMSLVYSLFRPLSHIFQYVNGIPMLQSIKLPVIGHISCDYVTNITEEQTQMEEYIMIALLCIFVNLPIWIIRQAFSFANTRRAKNGSCGITQAGHRRAICGNVAKKRGATPVCCLAASSGVTRVQMKPGQLPNTKLIIIMIIVN